MPGRSPKRPAPREFDVLDALWNLGPSRVREVREHFAQAGEDLAYNTVQTLLNRLADKGLVRVDRRGNAHVYRAAVRRDAAYAARVRGFVQEVFDGSALPLVTHLLRNGRLKQSELKELRALIDAQTAGRRGSKRRRST